MIRTFLFTDIEGSTSLWEAHPDAMRRDLSQHDRLLRETIAAHGGEVVKGTGDGVHATFDDPLNAFGAAIATQRAIRAASWSVPGGLRVRMGLHTGDAKPRDGDWYGGAVNRAARVMGLAHGGQTLVSEATAMLARDTLPSGSTLLDLGTHDLKNLSRPERVFQLGADGLDSAFPPIGNPVTGIVPQSVTSFVGRESELEALRPLVATGRLVTLLGPGGTGKTRLAIRLAHETILAGGASFVDLARLSDPSLVPAATAQAAGVRESAGTPIGVTLVEKLRERRMLLVLDNCEHLVAACAELANALVVGCPGLTLLATSREALGVPGEVTFPVPPLGLPDPHVADSFARSEAVELFVARACAAVPAFAVTDDTRVTIAEICRRLDGIPLAIELAAARVRVLSLADILKRLDDRFALLTNGGRTVLPRQQTLKALIDWSYKLLDEDERRVYRRLGTFPGDFDIEALEAVCGQDALDVLFQLVAKSLVGRNDRGTETRWRMLDSIRAHAREELAAAGEEQDARHRHLEWCRSLCRRAEPELIGKDQRIWFDHLETEHHQLRAALAWGQRFHPREALDLAKMAFWFWQARGHQSEGRTWTDTALAHPAASARDALRQGALIAGGSLAWTSGDWTAADRALGEAAEIALELGDTRGRVVAQCLQGQSRVFAGDHAGARAVLDEAILLARKLGDPYPLARSLGSMADLERQEGNDLRLVACADEALSTFQTIGMNEGIAFNLAYGAWGRRDSDPDEARARLVLALEHFDRLDHAYGFAYALLLWHLVVGLDALTSARVLGAVDAHSARSSMPHSTHDDRLIQTATERTRRELGEDGFHAAFEEGRSLSSTEVLDLVRASRRARGGH